ncbi:MAG: hypothetical protein KKA73_15480 [Chloroflexi bacterium]|nr:hypothetical protein [Chloroflexota bacterium]
MAQPSQVVVKRARRQDLAEILEFLSATRPAQPVTEEELLEQLLTWGVFLVRTAQLRGIVRWQAANLVGVMRGFWVWPRQQQRYTGGALLAAVEQAAYDLFCEGLVILVEPDTPASTLGLFAAHGYEPQSADDLNRYWRDAVREVLTPTDQLWIKRIRKRVTFDDVR